MAVAVGAVFTSALLLAPQRGVVAGARRRHRQRWDFAVEVLLIHLFHHEHLPEADQENRVEHLSDHVAWSEPFAARVVELAEERGWMSSQAGALYLTDKGRANAQRAAVQSR